MMYTLIRLFLKAFALLRRAASALIKSSAFLLICAMLLFNAATLTLSNLNFMASSLIEIVTGFDTARTKTAKELDRTKLRANQLEAELTSSKAKLETESRKSKILARKYGVAEVEAKRLRVNGPDIEFRGKKRSMRSIVNEVTGSVRLRTARVASANVGSMAGEGIPVWGIAVIVGATSLEIYSACDTMKDMHDLEVALLPDAPPTSDDVTEVCGLAIPTAAELWTMIKSSPSAAWDAASEFISSLPDHNFNMSSWLSIPWGEPDTGPFITEPDDQP